MKTLMVTSRHFPGVGAVADHGLSLGIWDKVLVEDGHDWENLARTYEQWVLGAWHPEYERLVRFPVKKSVLWTSSPGQTAFREIDIFDRVNVLREDGAVDLWFGSAEFATVFEKQKGVCHFPYPFDVDLVRQYLPVKKSEKKDFNVAFFSPPDPRKNLMVQYQGFVLAQRANSKMVLHTNVVKDQAQSFVNNYGWLPGSEYYALLSRCRMSLQVFPFESFAYSAAEAIVCGSIPVVSSTVSENLSLRNEAPLVWNVDSPREVARQLLSVASFDAEEALQMSARVRKAFDKGVEKRNAECLKFLEGRHKA